MGIDGNYHDIRNKYIYGLDRVLCEGPYSVNTYYQQNSHGDTITITDGNADTLVMYEYDAFGNQLDADPNDTNPFRYCGQYLDNETGSYYLRARYYQPTYGRFLTADSHWNTDNMIYGDNPVKINKRENPYNVNAPMSFAYLPDMTAMLQSGNLYGYSANSPLMYKDLSGEDFFAGVIAIAVVAIIALCVKSCENPEASVTYIKKNAPMSLSINIDDRKLQHEYSHAGDYGVTGNWNSQNAALFKQSIFDAVAKVPAPILGTFRGTIPVYHYYDKETGIDTMIDMDGNFVAGWKLSKEQRAHLQMSGNVQ